MKSTTLIVFAFLFANITQNCWATTYNFDGNDDWSGGDRSYSGNTGTSINLNNSANSGKITTDENINTNTNANYGVNINNGGNATFDNIGSSSNGNTFTSSENGQEGFNVSGTNSKLTINNMNITANKNSNGIYIMNGGIMNIQGDSSQEMKVTNSNTTGIYINNSNSALNITDMNVTISGNNSHGIEANNGSIINIINNSHSTQNLNVANNTNTGFIIDRDSVLKVKNMEVSFTGNGTGLRVSNGEANFTGRGTETFSSFQNNGKGVVVENSSSLDITDMNVTMERNGNNGMEILGGSTVNIINYGSGSLQMNVDNNKDKGIYISNSALNVKNMEVSLSGNSGNGLEIQNGSIVKFDGNGTETFKASNNENKGVYINNSSSLNIKDMNASFNSNLASGLEASAGSTVFIKGDGLDFNANNNTLKGVNADGRDTSITIENMDIYANKNNFAGLSSNNNATLIIKGNNNNLLVNENGSGGGFETGGIVTNNGVIQIDNMNIKVNETKANASLWAIYGGKLLISGNGTNTLEILDGVGSGINSDNIYNGSSVISISKMNISINNNDSYGIVASNGGNINIVGENNTLSLYGNTLYGMVAKGISEINVVDMIINGSTLDKALIGVEDEGVINFVDSNIVSDNASLFYTSGTSTEASKITLTNSIAKSDGTSLLISDADNATFDVIDSILENAIITENGKILKTVMTSSHWSMKNNSNMTGLTATGSTIDLRKSNGYNSLTLNNLTSNGTSYLINTYFDIDGQTTDKIIVDGGDATGSNNIINVNSTGYDSSNKTNGYGIQVVNLDSATDKNIDFSLDGGVVDSGAYEYELYRAADDNYYLQSSNKSTAIANTIANMPAVQISSVKTGMNEMRKRFGELRNENSENINGLWLRSYAKALKIDDTIDSKMNLYGLEAGYDGTIYNDGESKVIAGLMIGYMYTDKIRHHDGSRYRGDSTANTPSIGLYSTWFNKTGWFVDATTRYFYSMMDAKNYTANGNKIDYDADRNFLTASLELGK